MSICTQNDKVGIIILLIAYGIAGYVWYETVQSTDPTQLLASITIFFEYQLGQLSSSFTSFILSLLSDIKISFQIVIIAVVASIIVTHIYVWCLSMDCFRRRLRKMAGGCIALSGSVTAILLIYQAPTVDGPVIKAGQYIFGAVVAVFTLFTSVYSIWYKSKDEEDKWLSRAIVKLSTERAKQYFFIAFIPLLFISLVLIWWLAFTYLFYAIYSKEQWSSWYIWYHIFMGFYVLNGIYLFSSLSIAVYIDIVYPDMYVKTVTKNNCRHTVISSCCPLPASMIIVITERLGSIGIQSLLLIWCSPLSKAVQILSVLGKALEKVTTDIEAIYSRPGLIPYLICCFCAPIQCLTKCCGCSFKNLAICLKTLCCAHLVDINTICYQAKHSDSSMCHSYKKIRSLINEDLEDSVDQIVDWALYVSEVWIPFFTSAVCLMIIFIDIKCSNIFDIKNDINSVLPPAIVSLIIGIIIGNLYLSIHRLAAHVAFIEEQERKRRKSSTVI